MIELIELIGISIQELNNLSAVVQYDSFPVRHYRAYDKSSVFQEIIRYREKFII